VFIAILEDTDVSLAAVTFNISCALNANINDITVHCRVNQRVVCVCVFLSFDVDIGLILFYFDLA